jgi:hypothetical protein
MGEALNCVEVVALLPELSAGVAEGGARAWALAHLADCADCRRELDETTAVLDGLILLSPEHQPAAGFEDAVLEALFPVGAGSSRTTRVLLGAAASILVAALGAGLVWWQTGDDRQLAAQYRRTLSVADGRYLAATRVSTATGATAGQVLAYAGHPSWAFMTINRAPSSGTLPGATRDDPPPHHRGRPMQDRGAARHLGVAAAPAGGRDRTNPADARWSSDHERHIRIARQGYASPLPPRSPRALRRLRAPIGYVPTRRPGTQGRQR